MTTYIALQYMWQVFVKTNSDSIEQSIVGAGRNFHNFISTNKDIPKCDPGLMDHISDHHQMGYTLVDVLPSGPFNSVGAGQQTFRHSIAIHGLQFLQAVLSLLIFKYLANITPNSNLNCCDHPKHHRLDNWCKHSESCRDKAI